MGVFAKRSPNKSEIQKCFKHHQLNTVGDALKFVRDLTKDTKSTVTIMISEHEVYVGEPDVMMQKVSISGLQRKMGVIRSRGLSTWLITSNRVPPCVEMKIVLQQEKGLNSLL